MTNEEAIKELKTYMPKDNGMNDKDILAFNIAINSIQENTKLKTVIEEYFKVVTEQSKLNVEQFKRLDEQYQRIEQLYRSNFDVCEINGRLVRQNTNQGFKIKDLEKDNTKLCEENEKLKIQLEKLEKLRTKVLQDNYYLTNYVTYYGMSN